MVSWENTGIETNEFDETSLVVAEPTWRSRSGDHYRIFHGYEFLKEFNCNASEPFHAEMIVNDQSNIGSGGPRL